MTKKIHASRICYASKITNNILSHDFNTSDCQIEMPIEGGYFKIPVSFKDFTKLLRKSNYYRLDDKI